ncbi:GNAT family N-acetyltransferase [Peribacillus sp. SCS-155]|uniref:GNAT family N-acetyltransferase n=1 Tax=Peribacillus sedimenti TaxID=3115297 RepID=UPI003905F2A8
MNIRTETPADHEKVYQIHYLAFQNREDESRLVERIRLSEQFIPELSIVAENETEIIGHILLSKAKIINDDTEHEVIVLAPVAVKPGYQKSGAGSSLIKEGLSRCRAMGYDLVLLIGHPGYYPRFHFMPARKYGLELTQFSVPDEVFRVHELRPGALHSVKGELIYPQAFFS